MLSRFELRKKTFTNKKAITQTTAIIAIIVIVLAAVAGIWYYVTYLTPKPMLTIYFEHEAAPEADYAEAQVNYWNEHYANKTGIYVDYKITSFVGFFDRLTTQLVSDAPTPDIVAPWGYYVAEYAPYLEPLNEYYEDPELFSSPDGEPYEDTFYSWLREASMWEGKIYSPYYIVAYITLTYRTDLIDKPPDTWDEFFDLARNFTKSVNSDSPTTYGAALCGRGPEDTTTWKSWLSAYWSLGGTYFEPDTWIPDFNSTAGVQAMDIWYTLATEELIPPDTPTFAFMETLAAMQSGEIAMAINWQHVYPMLIDSETSPLVSDKIAMVSVPGVKQTNGTIKRVPYLGSGCLSINNDSEHKREAFKFLAWFLHGEGMWRNTELGLTPADRRPYENSTYVEQYEWIRLMTTLGLIDEGRPETVFPEMPTVQSLGAGVLNTVLGLGLTPEAAADRLQQEAYDELERAGYYD